VHASHPIIFLIFASSGVLLSIPHTYATIFIGYFRNSLFFPEIVPHVYSISASILSSEIITSSTYCHIPSATSSGMPFLYKNMLEEAALTAMSSINSFRIPTAI